MLYKLGHHSNDCTGFCLTSVIMLCTKPQSKTALCCFVIFNSNTLIVGDNGELTKHSDPERKQHLKVAKMNQNLIENKMWKCILSLFM